MRIYNLFYLVGSESLDEEVKSLQDRMMTKIEEMGGIAIGSERPVKRNLVKPIKKMEQAYISNLRFQLPQEKLPELEQNLKSEPKIIRFLISKQEIERVEAPRRRRISKPKVELEKIEEKLKELLNE